MFSNMEVNKKRIEIRKLKRKGLSDTFIKMFIKLLEYISEIQQNIGNTWKKRVVIKSLFKASLRWWKSSNKNL